MRIIVLHTPQPHARNTSPLLVALTTFLFVVALVSISEIARAFPNPGHPWTDVGNGTFQVTGQTALRTFTFPDQDATILTTAVLVSVAQGGTGTGTLTGILKGNGTSAFTAVTAPAGAIVGDTDTQTLSNKTLTLPQINGFDINRALLVASTTLTSSSATVELVDASTTPITVTLPVSTTSIDGILFVIKKIDVGLANLVTVNTQSSQTIDGLSAITLAQRGEAAIVQSDGANWRILTRRDYDISAYHAKGTTLNQWYTAPNSGTALTTGAPAINTLFAIPYIVSKVTTIDQMAINVTTGGTTSNARVGIYADNGNLYPGALVVDAGSSATTATGVKTYTTGLPITIDPGLYWLAFNSNGTAATIRGLSVASLNPVLGYASTLPTNAQFGWSAALTFGALPATFTAGGAAITAVPIPAIYVRTSQ